MKRILCHLPNFLLLISAAVIPPPLLLLNGSEIAASVPLGTGVDPRFSLKARFDGPQLQPIPCLANTVKLLKTLAIEGFWADMGRTSIKFDDYAHVGVVISPERWGGRIGHRFVIWGLGRGVTEMILSDRWQKVAFTLFWEGSEIGTIQLIDWPEAQYTNQTIHTNSTLNLSQLSTLSLAQNPSTLPASINDTTTQPEDAHMNLQITMTGIGVPAFDVYLLVIAVIVDIAPFAPTLPLQTYISPRNAVNIGIIFGQPTAARTEAPFFEVQWLISAMVLIPDQMIRKGRFQEAHVFIDIDGVRVADGFLGTKRGGGGSAGVTGNISVS